ncbi:hypothetical protein, partial [endosymbiont GvMRE of Glomus versiforme]|uniref:hypothetical protein n=1 Tax=endosymbiont GvMRE of Glomus versiforme TaxID=2039283 RepID=UPI0011C3DF6E
MSEKIKCSKDNPCEECIKKQKELLEKTENWEVKKKEKLEKFEFIEAEFCHNKNPDNPNKVQYSSFVHGINYNNETCPSCQAVIKIIKSNSYGDQTEELKEHASNCQQKSNQSTSSSK